MYKYWLSMIMAVVISSFSQMLLKKATFVKYENKIREYMNFWVISGYSLLVGSTLLVIYAYKGIEFKNGAVIESFGYMFVMLLSSLFFKEKITRQKLIGNIIILIGIFVFYL